MELNEFKAITTNNNKVAKDKLDLENLKREKVYIEGKLNPYLTNKIEKIISYKEEFKEITLLNNAILDFNSRKLMLEVNLKNSNVKLNEKKKSLNKLNDDLEYLKTSLANTNLFSSKKKKESIRDSISNQEEQIKIAKDNYTINSSNIQTVTNNITIVSEKLENFTNELIIKIKDFNKKYDISKEVINNKNVLSVYKDIAKHNKNLEGYVKTTPYTLPKNNDELIRLEQKLIDINNKIEELNNTILNGNKKV